MTLRWFLKCFWEVWLSGQRSLPTSVLSPQIKCLLTICKIHGAQPPRARPISTLRYRSEHDAKHGPSTSQNAVLRASGLPKPQERAEPAAPQRRGGHVRSQPGAAHRARPAGAAKTEPSTTHSSPPKAWQAQAPGMQNAEAWWHRRTKPPLPAGCPHCQQLSGSWPSCG